MSPSILLAHAHDTVTTNGLYGTNWTLHSLLFVTASILYATNYYAYPIPVGALVIKDEFKE